MLTDDTVLHLKDRSSKSKSIAKILKKTPKHSIDNVLIEALVLIGADTITYSELILKAKELIQNSRERYVLVHKDLI